MICFVREFDRAVDGHRYGNKEKSEIYNDIIRAMHPNLSLTSPLAKSVTASLKHNLAFGKRWARLAKTFGIGYIRLIPRAVELGVTNQIIQKHFKNDTFNLLVEILEREQGEALR